MNGASISVELEGVHETIVRLLLAVKDLTARVEALEQEQRDRETTEMERSERG